MDAVTTLDEARALVGRTFERDGEMRRLKAVFSNGCMRYVAFMEPDDTLGFTFTVTRKKFNDWLSGAKEVVE